MIVLQGPPACGKSTRAKELLAQYGSDKAVIVCRDSIREACGEYWVPEREEYISDLENSAVDRALTRGLIPIIDATNLNKKTTNKWIKMAEGHDAEIEWIEVVVPYQEALKRDSNPDRKRPVGKKVLRDFYTRYYPELIASMSDERYMLEWNNKPKAIIVDIDGTLALRNNRSPFDYTKVGEDRPDFRMCNIIKGLIESEELYEVFFVTGREDIGNCRELTEKWIEEHIYPHFYHKMGYIPEENWKLIMRPEGDHRSDEIVKKELWEQKIKPWFDVVAVFDDRDRVVKMWREEGLLCLQPYYGDF